MISVQCLEMTTKRKLIGRLVPCRCFRGEEEVISVLDYSHCSLQQVPKEIFSFERTLEELYLDANQIEELPKQLFNCQALKKLSMPDNDLSNLPTTIASLVNLKELDISKNGIQEFPDNIKCCKGLSVVEASVNPITKLPEGFTQLLNLTQLFLNDAFLEYLPANFGRLSKLRILELRENHLKTLPKSIHRLTQLERLDLGSNEFSEMPEVLEQIHNLKELWMDNNSLQNIPGSIGKLRQLRYLDLAKNRIETLDSDISGCEALEDLLLSSNMLQQLPDSIGMLKKLTTLKVDDNQLTSLPNSIGSPKPKQGLSLLEELDCSCNELESLPPTIGYLHSLRTFAADENFLTELPREIGNCRNVTVMSLRSNKLEFLPDEIGQMTKLRVLNLSDNRLKNLPFTFTKLKDLAALWLSDNQSKALIPLQTEAHPETKQKVLTNYMFPQQPRHDEDYQSDSDSFNPTLWEEQRQQRMTVAFDFEDKKEDEDNSGKVKVEINLKRYPTPYPEDLKNMVKSVQSLVGKSVHAGHHHQHQMSGGTVTTATNMEHSHMGKEPYEPPWPLPPKEVTDREMQDFSQSQLMDQGQMHNSGIDIPKRKDKEDLTESSEDSMGGSPNDIRISDMRPTLVEPPMYKPKVVLLGKDKKESTDEEVDKMHCLNHSGSSATYSDYSPSQGSSGSSNPPNAHNLPHNHPHPPTMVPPTKEQPPQTHWTNRLAQSFPKPIDSKPLLSQRETPPSGTLQQRGDRRPLSEPFDWAEAPHYDNTGFDAEESALEPSSSSQGNPPLGSKPRSQSAHGRRPLLRQERIVGVPLELDAQTLPYHSSQRPGPDQDPCGPHNPWQNWTRTPSPLEDRTAFPSKLDMSPSSSPQPDRKDMDQRRSDQSAGPLPGSWSYNQHEQTRKDQLTVSGGNKVTVVMSKSSDRLSPMMRETRSKFKKSQSIDEIDIGSYKVYSIPVDSYSSSIEQQTSLDRPELPGSMEQSSMSRSQSAPMLDDDLVFTGHGVNQNQPGQNQKPNIPQKAYHFDQNYNPQVTIDRRVPPPFPNTPDYVNHSTKAIEYLNQPSKTLTKDLVSPRYRDYPPIEMFSFPQPPQTQDGPQTQSQQPLPSQRSRPGFLRRADSLVSSTELALFRRVQEAQQEALQEQYRQQMEPPLYGRALAYSTIMDQSALSNMADSQTQMLHNKRNGRYDDDYSAYQDQKKPMIGYPTKSLTQRRPLSARSYSTETYGASQARPVSARPTMAALLEKMPPDYTLATCPEKASEDTIKVRPVVPQKPEDITSKMPPDWRQQLLRHIEAKRLDRSGVLKHNTLTLGMLCQGGGHFNLYNNNKHEPPAGRWLPLPPPPNSNATPSQQSAILDNDQEGGTAGNQWVPYSLGRRDVPPDNLMKKGGHAHNPSHQTHNAMIVTTSSSSATISHRVGGQQGYDNMMNKGGQYQPGMPLSVVPAGQYQASMQQALPAPGQAYPSSGLPMALSPSGNQPQFTSHQPALPATNPQYHANQGMSHSNQNVMHANQVVMHSNQVVTTTHTNPRPQSARCLQTKGQKSTDGFQEQLCVRIEKNPGLGFSISGGISGQGNPFKPSDMGIFVTRVQHDGPAASVLQPGDKILQANGHSFLNLEHDVAVSLLKNFSRTVDLVLLRDSSSSH
ncbi:leucine-rich repeat-containing protein 7 [Boleophthalmus pectinirostris]|uniref:leucine-rich repeat-containing protein 7 n=1 Tax=Boleophthalmus pectinirostris TaxID=150288 RepID=UPI00242EAC4D|nr:leucine-rich repeat-containing protein 7 [Boleophthalmus pectinirostris]